MSAPRRVRLELDQGRARALHAALSEALGAKLLAGEHRDAAYELLDQLDGRVPGWLDAGPVGGDAGYLLAAEAVLRELVDAEERGRSALAESELVHALGTAKPLGASASDVLVRMRREGLLRPWSEHGGEPWWTAAPAGRQFLARDTAARDAAWTVRDPDGLLDLIYAEQGPGGRAHRPSVQAIGRLDDEDLEPLLTELRALGNLEAATNGTWLELSVQASRPPGSAGDRARPTGWGPGTGRRRRRGRTAASYRSPTPSRIAGTRTAGATRRAASITCRRRGLRVRARPSCGPRCAGTVPSRGGSGTASRGWLVYLQACGGDGRPVYRDPAAATHNRPYWRPTHKP